MKYPQLVSMPSEISDWLEEQLEARGIDSVVYTRYILSLLYRDSVDVVCPDRDLHFTQSNKEVRRSGGGCKRFRCFAKWRNHAYADAEQLKRSAAIECLMSASDQSYGIESLVDELCEKLEKIKSDSAVNVTSLPACSKSTDLHSTSPRELAKQYYAAFPPLKHRTSDTPNRLVTLIPTRFSSPKKRSARRQSRPASCDEKLYHKIDTDTMKSRNSGKQRLGYFSRSRNELGYSCSIAKSMERSESMARWDLVVFSKHLKNKLSNNNSETFGNIFEERSCQNLDGTGKLPKADEYSCHSWSDEDSMAICESLPVDIIDLLDSPSPKDCAVEMMNVKRQPTNKNFIHSGTNLTSSIWSMDAVMDDSSMYCNRYNAALDGDQSDNLLGMKFKSLSVDNKSLKHIWSNPDLERNEQNMLNEGFKNKSGLPNVFSGSSHFQQSSFLPGVWSTGQEKCKKWSEADYSNEQVLMNITKSFIKLNHSREKSSFTEVMPRTGISNLNFLNKTDSSGQVPSTIKKQSDDSEEENLLTSALSHFKPINSVNTLNENINQRKYADGTSFVISAALDNPNYKRSNSGTEYLETDYGSPKRLLEYKKMDKGSVKSALVLKFFVSQNDKACQTDMIDDQKDDLDIQHEVPCKKLVMSVERDNFFFPGDEEFLMDEAEPCACTCQKKPDKSAMNTDFPNKDNMVICPLHVTRPDSMLAEMWKADSKQCDKCNSNSVSWNNNWTRTGSSEWGWDSNKDSLQNIWNGGEVCSTCLRLNDRGYLPLSSQQSQLREDISQDGEQLLSDLSSLQKSYMEQLPTNEISYDISELIIGTKERKRRHSPAAAVHHGSWSIASHIKRDQFMQVKANVPVLHSVTL